MNQYPFWKSLAIAVPLLLAAALQGAAVTNPRCEYRTDPLGIDVAKPRMSCGLVPNIAPEYMVCAGDFRDSPEWGSAYGREIPAHGKRRGGL